MKGSVVIPAHNEAAVIGRTLASVADAARRGDLEVVVVANGCTDDTATRARSVTGVRVVELVEGSKTAALRAGDSAATSWPRLYLDADIVLPATSVNAVLAALRDGRAEAARPAFRYETRGASWLVRQYYRARSEMPSVNSALWGAGVYGLSETGRSRFGPFPDVIGDDLYVDRLFAAREKVVVRGAPAIVAVPRRARALLSVLGRVYGGQEEAGSQDTMSSAVRDLVAVARRGPRGAVAAAVYAAFAVTARLRARRGGNADTWARDETTR